jgi:hypothetical protein
MTYLSSVRSIGVVDTLGCEWPLTAHTASLVPHASRRNRLTQARAVAQRRRRERVFVPHTCRSKSRRDRLSCVVCRHSPGPAQAIRLRCFRTLPLSPGTGRSDATRSLPTCCLHDCFGHSRWVVRRHNIAQSAVQTFVKLARRDGSQSPSRR